MKTWANGSDNILRTPCIIKTNRNNENERSVVDDDDGHNGVVLEGGVRDPLLGLKQYDDH